VSSTLSTTFGNEPVWNSIIEVTTWGQLRPLRVNRDLDEHAETIKAALPELGQKPSEYVTGGRYFQSIEIPEGAKLTNAVIDLIGDHVLMYASDYPHVESHFPESVSLMLDWVVDAERSASSSGTTPSGSMHGRRSGEVAGLRGRQVWAAIAPQREAYACSRKRWRWSMQRPEIRTGQHCASPGHRRAGLDEATGAGREQCADRSERGGQNRSTVRQGWVRAGYRERSAVPRLRRVQLHDGCGACDRRRYDSTPPQSPHRAKWKARSFVRYSPALIRLSLAHALSSQIVSCRTVS